MRVAACSWMALVSRGWQWPMLQTAMPVQKSRYSLPVSSHSVVPLAFAGTMGILP